MSAMDEPQNGQDLRRRRRVRNFALAAVLFAFVVVVYFVSGRWFVRGIAAGAVKG